MKIKHALHLITNLVETKGEQRHGDALVVIRKELVEILKTPTNKRSTPCKYDFNHSIMKVDGSKFCRHCGCKL